MPGFIEEGGGSEFSGTYFAATFPDTYGWGDATWKSVTVDLVGSSTWSVTSSSVARFPVRLAADATNNPFRYILVGKIPTGVSGGWKVRVTASSGASMTTASDAVDRGACAGTLSYSAGTYTHAPNGSGLFQLLGIWADGTNIPKLGWKPIPGASATTSESDPYFRPSAMSGKPAYALCVQVYDVNSTDTAKNCGYVRLASSIVT